MEPYPIRRQRAKAEKQAAAWNDAHPVGTPVRYYPAKNGLDYRETRTRSAAWVMPSPVAVVLVEGIAGGVSIDHCRPVPVPAG